MPEKTKRNKDVKKSAKEVADLSADRHEEEAKDNWSADQKGKSYYYDDSYGYEIYNPDEDEED